MISWTNVSVRYNGTTVLGPLSLEVARGEWLGLIGPNGSGKTTMLKAALGLVEHTGLCALDGADPESGGGLAWMPQRPQLPDEMGVFDYVLLGRSPHIGYFGVESRSDIESADTALGRLGLTKFARRRLSTLSGGEMQKAVLARALAQEAPTLFLDEPTASLDIGHAIEVMEVIDALRRDDGLTVISAVHDLTLAGRFADRLALLSGGTIVAEGLPGEVLTEELLHAHYGPGLRVVSDSDGPTVIPMRRSND